MLVGLTFLTNMAVTVLGLARVSVLMVMSTFLGGEPRAMLDTPFSANTVNLRGLELLVQIIRIL